jgi:hypothetical protein
MSSFLADAAKVGAAIQGETTFTAFANDIVGTPDNQASGVNAILSSRLVPGSVYSNAPESVGTAYKQLISQGIQSVDGLLVAGGGLCFRKKLCPHLKLTNHVGQVAANSHMDSAVLPAWRLAKTHVSMLPDTVVYWSQSNMTDSARSSPSTVGTIPCPPRMSRRCERISLRQLDLFLRSLLVGNPVVATQMRAMCSSQTFRSRSSAATIHVSRRSKLNTTQTTYLSSQPASGVNSGTRKGCARYHRSSICTVDCFPHRCRTPTISHARHCQ